MKYINFYIFIFFLISLVLTEKKESKYKGDWPTNNIDKKVIKSNILPLCPYDIGCTCTNNSDCTNNNCIKIPRGSYCFPTTGDYFPDFKGIDQFDEIVDIYDFSNQNKYILIEMAAEWCSPCHVLSNWITFKDEEIYTHKWWKEEYNIIHDLIHNNEIFFITVMYENEFKENATYQTVSEWYQNYPDDKIPILADSNKYLHTWLKPAGIPAIILLDQNMKIVEYTNRGLNATFDKLVKIYNDIESSK